jgi:preprotein translocase subunit SecA
MDHLRESVGLRAYGQKDPLIEFKQEGYDMFAAMTSTIKKEIVANVFRTSSVPSPAALPFGIRPQDLLYSDGSSMLAPETTTFSGAEGDMATPPVKAHTPYVRQQKKYKKCCGANQ